LDVTKLLLILKQRKPLNSRFFEREDEDSTRTPTCKVRCLSPAELTLA